MPVPEISQGRRSRFDEAGMALATAVILLLVLGLLVSTAVRYAVHDIHRTENYYKTRQAFYIAEAGLADALHQFNRDAAGTFPGASGNGFDDELNAASPDWGPFNNVPFADGAYTVEIADNNDGDGNDMADSDDVVILTVTGETRGTRATLEAVVRRGGRVQEHALVTNKKLTMSGSFDISGKQGSAHSNADLDHTTATGECSGGSCIESNVDAEPVLEFDPEDFRKYANLILKDNGEIDAMDPSVDPPALLITYINDGCWRPKDGGGCMPWDSMEQIIDDDDPDLNKVWLISGENAPDNSMLFIEAGEAGTRGRIKITGSPSPWTVSIISTGYISIAGNSELRNFRNPALGRSIQDLMFMTGTDFNIVGNALIGDGDPNIYDPAYIAVLDQVNLIGDSIVDGWIQAADQKPSPSSDADGLVNENVVSGNFKLRYEGGPESPFPGKVKILSWREMSSSS